ncbi:MAG: hypothetical protein ABIF87_10840 [Pseudomonadota bacterium]
MSSFVLIPRSPSRLGGTTPLVETFVPALWNATLFLQGGLVLGENLSLLDEH